MHQNCEEPYICIECGKAFDYNTIAWLVDIQDMECPYCGGGLKEAGTLIKPEP